MSAGAGVDLRDMLERARAARQSGDDGLAYELFVQATERQPDAAEAWVGRAETSPLPDDVLMSRGFAVALDRENAPLQKQLQEQIQARVTAATREDGATLTYVGQQFAQVGLRDEALQFLRRAAALDAPPAETLVWLAAVTPDRVEAQAALKQALERDPQDPRARAGLDALASETDHAPTPAAAPAAEPQGAPADPASQLIREGEMALSKGDKAHALELFTRATELSPHSERAWLGRARATQDLDETLTCLEQALAINPDNVQTREARTFYRVRKLREGIRRPEGTGEPVPTEAAFGGIGALSTGPTPEARGGRILLLLLLVLLLLGLVGLLVFRFR